MKKWLSVVLVLLSLQTFSQSSFRVQIDTAIKFADFEDIPPQIIICSDSGIAIAGISTDLISGNSKSCVLRTDSIGNLQWYKHFIEASDFARIQIISASSGTIYLNSTKWDDWAADYAFPRIQKINKFGTILETRYPDSPSLITEGHIINFYAVEKYNDNLHAGGGRWQYDPITDNPCCYSSFSFKCDSNLNILKKRTFDFLLYDSLNIPYHAFKLIGFDNHSFGIGLSDTSGFQNATHYYSYDSTLMDYYLTQNLIQVENGFVMVHIVIINSQWKYAIHKVNNQLNTEFFTVLDSIDSGSFFASRMFQEIAMNNTGGIYFSALNKNNNQISTGLRSSSAVMLEMDSIGNFYNIWTSADTLYLDNAIDTLTKSALFLKAVPNSSYQWVNAEFQKEYFTAPSCGMQPATIKSFQLSIIDSSNIDTISFVPGYYPFFINYTFPALVASTPTLTPICGPLALSEPNIQNRCAITIFPNPSATGFNIRSGCRFKENSEMTIYNIMGGEVLRGQIDKESQEIHFKINNLPSGIYFIKGHFADGGVFNEKIVVQK